MIQYAVKAKEDKVKQYAIYDHEQTDNGEGLTHDSKQLVGYTYAVSPQQAVNRVAYRHGRHVVEFHEWAYDGGRWSTYEAVEVAE